MTKNKRSLYECDHAHLYIDTIYCKIGHKLNRNGDVSADRLGNPLELAVCQNCPDIDYEEWEGEV